MPLSPVSLTIIKNFDFCQPNRFSITNKVEHLRFCSFFSLNCLVTVSAHLSVGLLIFVSLLLSGALHILKAQVVKGGEIYFFLTVCLDINVLMAAFCAEVLL